MIDRFLPQVSVLLGSRSHAKAGPAELQMEAGQYFFPGSIFYNCCVVQ